MGYGFDAAKIVFQGEMLVGGVGVFVGQAEAGKARIGAADQLTASLNLIERACIGGEDGHGAERRPDQAAAKIIAAYEAGCRRFDSALGGLGGCPFAQDALVGNIATETVIEALRKRGAELPDLKPLDSLLKASAGISAKFSSSHAAD